MKQVKNNALSSLWSSKLYFAVFMVIYLINVRFNALFAEYAGLSLDIASSNDMGQL